MNIARMDSARRAVRPPRPPASDESAASPVIVKVSTVVVRALAAVRSRAVSTYVAISI
jgi:hypothetical protein